MQESSCQLLTVNCKLADLNHEGHEGKDKHEDHEERSRNFVLVVSQSCMRD